jgi:hypothetical protein
LTVSANDKQRRQRRAAATRRAKRQAKQRAARAKARRRRVPTRIRWISAGDSAAAEYSARAAVAALCGQPQPSSRRPKVRPTGRRLAELAGLAPAEPPEPAPLGHQPDRSILPPRIAPGDRQLGRSRPGSPDQGIARATRTVAIAGSEMAGIEAMPISAPRPNKKPSPLPANRGGLGGRQAREGSSQPLLGELAKLLGEGERITGVGCQMVIYRPSHAAILSLRPPHLAMPTGRLREGIAMGRMSGRDAQNGDTEATQLNSLLEMLALEGMLPRVVIFTLDNSGFKEEEDRPDLTLCHELMTQPWCEFVAWRGMDRITRDYLPGDRHLHLLKKNKVDLYLLSLRRVVDWQADDLTLRAQMMAAKVEGESIRQRTHDALVRRWLDEGRGWPGSIRYATMRDPKTKFLVPAPDGKQMQIVHFLHSRYTAPGETVSVRQLTREVTDKFKGATLSAPTVNRLLRDPIYVTGEWWVSYCGELYRGKLLQWDNPVALETYQRTQELLTLRGGARSQDSEGLFALNGLLRHARCQHMHSADDKLYRLRGSAATRGRPTYYHAPGTPTDECRGFTLPVDVIEPAVMAALRQLAEDDQLQKAWHERAQRSIEPPTETFSEQQLDELQQERKRLINQRNSFEAREVERCVAGGHDLDLERIGRLTKLIDDGIKELDARIELAVHANQAPQARVEPEARDLQTLRDRICATLTDEVPEDSELRRTRAILVRSLLSAVVVERDEDELRIELYGWLEGPKDKPLAVLEVAERALRDSDDPQSPATRQGQVTCMLHDQPIGSVLARRELAQAANDVAEQQVPTELQEASCNAVGSQMGTAAPRLARRIDRAPLVASERLHRPYQQLETASCGAGLRPAPMHRISLTSRMSVGLGRVSRIGDWRPAFESPGIQACSGQTRGELALLRSREALRAVAIAMDPQAPRLTRELYGRLRDQLDPRPLSENQVSVGASRNGTTFASLAAQVLAEVRAACRDDSAFRRQP